MQNDLTTVSKFTINTVFTVDTENRQILKTI